ncbi:MAG: 2-C-methyl-D-erythritol 4-phosphate cytidylyltransferase [Magnetococcales bacterium]|nr:2-C-methyl-D-erythritol 4-phosphate cytidylyltransferase [Magnetococcales bacterium]
MDGLILAAGEGRRLGLGPKAFLQLAGHTLLAYVAWRLKEFTDRVVVAAPPEMVERCQTLVPWATVVVGGKSRQESLAILLAQAHAPYVLVADVARPFFPPAMVFAMMEAVHRSGATAPFLSSQVPNALASPDGLTTAAIPSHQLLIIQSPQLYQRATLQKVYAQAGLENRQRQSTVELCHAAGVAVAMVAGEESNIKITTPLDWQMAQTLLLPLLPSLPYGRLPER